MRRCTPTRSHNRPELQHSREEGLSPAGRRAGGPPCSPSSPSSPSLSQRRQTRVAVPRAAAVAAAVAAAASSRGRDSCSSSGKACESAKHWQCRWQGRQQRPGSNTVQAHSAHSCFFGSSWDGTGMATKPRSWRPSRGGHVFGQAGGMHTWLQTQAITKLSTENVD